MKEKGLAFEPDIVILGFVYDDVYRNLLEFRDFAKPRFFLSNGELQLTNSPVPTPESVYGWDWMRPRILDFAGVAWSRTKHRFWSSQKREMHQLALALLTEMADAIRESGARPLFVFLPTGVEMRRKNLADQHQAIFGWLRGKIPQAQTLSLLLAFRAQQKRGHKFEAKVPWTPFEHRIAAQNLKGFLLNSGLLPKPASRQAANPQ